MEKQLQLARNKVINIENYDSELCTPPKLLSNDALIEHLQDVILPRAAELALDALEEYLTNAEKLLKRARDIMVFHDMRCPIQPSKNYSGSEEHCAEYRAVMKDIAKFFSEHL